MYLVSFALVLVMLTKSIGFSSRYSQLFKSRCQTVVRSLSALVDFEESSLPPKLLQHVHRMIDRSSKHLSVAQTNPELVDEIVKELVRAPFLHDQKRFVFEKGMEIAESLDLLDAQENNFYDVLGRIDIEKIVALGKSRTKSRVDAFTSISQHHHKLTESSWDDAVDNNVSLKDYRKAAEVMGQKKWVQEGNEWMANFTTKFFTRGGARKYYIHSLSVAHDRATGQVMSDNERRRLGEILTDRLIPDSRKIRLLDVGSCYNPFAADTPENSLLDVTALDLYPAHPSVLQCDFLHVSVGSPGSAPVTVAPTKSVSCSDNGVDLDPDLMTKLLQLPAASYDVVTMSLVLNYLPTPAQRDSMIEKARQLLYHPKDPANPHRKGLLLVVEKNSIFGKNGPKTDTTDLGPDRAFLLNNWKQAICARGFELVHYRAVSCPDSSNKAHMYAFVTADIPETVSEAKVPKPSLWVRSDFQRQKLVSRGELTDSLPVGIIGGGLGGSALGLALQRVGLPVLIFEKDSHFDARKQGYALTMQQAGTALKEFGLNSAVAETGVVSTAHYSYDKNGRQIGAYGRALLKKKANSDRLIHIDEPDDNVESVEQCGEVHVNEIQTSDVLAETRLRPLKGRFNIHIPRQKLRELLVNQIKPEVIQWKKKLLDYEQCKDADGTAFVCVTFEDGSQYNVSALIGADGIYSTVRKHLLDPAKDAKLQYLGQMVVLGISDTPSNHSILTSGTFEKNGLLALNESEKMQIRNSLCQTQWLDGETRMFSMPFDAYRTMWQLSFPLTEKEALQLTTIEATQTSLDECERLVGIKLKEAALQQCRNWTKSALRLIENTNNTLISGHPVYDREPISTELFSNSTQEMCGAGQSLVTLLGDAAHPMSPFKGQGANVALLDALSLSHMLVTSDLYHPSRRPLTEALRDYEREMSERCSSKVLLSRSAAKYLHSPDALAEGNITRAQAAAQKSAKQANKV